MTSYDDAALGALRASVAGRLSPKRMRHVLGVEREAAELAGLLLPDAGAEPLLRAAALLHDLTKELPAEAQVALLESAGITPLPVELAAPKTLHAISAPVLIKSEYPEFADPDLLSAVRWHTTGRAGMTLPEKIIYLADYVEPTRTWPDCVKLRDAFWSASPEKMTPAELDAHLRSVLILSFDFTVRSLLDEGQPVHPATNEARNALIAEGKCAGGAI